MVIFISTNLTFFSTAARGVNGLPGNVSQAGGAGGVGGQGLGCGVQGLGGRGQGLHQGRHGIVDPGLAASHKGRAVVLDPAGEKTIKYDKPSFKRSLHW